MTVKIRDYELTYNSHRCYDVILDDTTEIDTVVTHDPYWLCVWINNIEIANQCRLDRLIVGLDIEWNPIFNSSTQNPVATLQLCVGTTCLIYQILHAPKIPRLLRKFLNNETYKFVGVGIHKDVKKLRNDYGLEVLNAVDLRHWAAGELSKKNLLNAGLKDLVKEVVGKEMEKPKSVTLSSWDQRWLSHNQIVYACLDAYLSFEVGRLLSAWY